MPVTTRTRTGKLPVKALTLSQSFSDIEEVEEVKGTDDSDLDLDGPTLIEQAPQEAPPRPDRFVFETFATFKSKHHLRDGLSLVRHLGGGKYEVINLQYVDPDIMGSEEVGNYLRSDPKRMEAFSQAKEGFTNSKLSIEQAANSASKSSPRECARRTFVLLQSLRKLPIFLYQCAMILYSFIVLRPSPSKSHLNCLFVRRNWIGYLLCSAC
jgi:hypothetical protein